MKKKQLEKFLRASQKFEARQVARRALEVEEAGAFNRQLEAFRSHQNERHTELATTHKEILRQQVTPMMAAEHEYRAARRQQLCEVERFEQDTLDSQQEAPDSAFALIAELQKICVGSSFQVRKPLPALPADELTLDLHDLAETQYQQELARNQQSLRHERTGEDERQDKPGSHPIFYFRPIKSREK